MAQYSIVVLAVDLFLVWPQQKTPKRARMCPLVLMWRTVHGAQLVPLFVGQIVEVVDG